MKKIRSSSYWNFSVLRLEIIRYFEIVLFMVRWAFRRFKKGKTDSNTCLVGKTAIVTGGSSGIGLATATLLAARGCRVIIANRRTSEIYKKFITQETNNPNIVTKSLDLSSMKSVRDFADDIKKTELKIDILINNAGIGASPQTCTTDGLNPVMQTNYFGAFLLTHLLLDCLKASGSARIVFTSSVLAVLHQLNLETLNPVDYEPTSDTIPLLYSNSKVCNILAAQEFAKRLKMHGIAVYSVDPGTSATPIFDSLKEHVRPSWLMRLGLAYLLIYKTDELAAAENTIHVSTSHQVQSGEHYFRCKPLPKPWICKNQSMCEQIWKRSEELVKLRIEEQTL